MSSVINPVGPEEPSTYWRRRAVVLVVLLVVLWLFWLLVRTALGGGGGGEAAVSPSPSPSFGISMSPEPDSSAEPGASASGSPTSPGPSESASASPTESPCADSAIRVSAATATESTAVGAGMGLTMTVTNTGSTACTRDVGAGVNELQVTSGSVLVWSSDFCNASSANDVQVLDPGEEWSTSIAWPGTIVAEGCPDNPPTAQAGSYRAVARNGEIEGEPVAFTVK